MNYTNEGAMYEDFKDNFKEFWNQFDELFQDLSNGRISPAEYFVKTVYLIMRKKS